MKKRFKSAFVASTVLAFITLPFSIFFFPVPLLEILIVIAVISFIGWRIAKEPEVSNVSQPIEPSNTVVADEQKVSRFNKLHKIRIGISAATLILGLLIIGLMLSSYGNPPQCDDTEKITTGAFGRPSCIIGANIGAGLYVFFGLALIWLGIIGLIASFLYRAHQLRPRTKTRVLLTVTAIIFFTPYILLFIFTAISVKEVEESEKQRGAAFREKYRSNFVEYNAPPNWNEVSGGSSTVRYLENQSLLMYLNECESGRSDAPYATGITYFVLSGVKDNACVFYIHDQAATAGPWDGRLRQKCVWNIEIDDDTPIFAAGPNGVEFGDFLTKNCKTI